MSRAHCVLLAAMLAGACIPDFHLDQRQFVEDASSSDSGAPDGTNGDPQKDDGLPCSAGTMGIGWVCRNGHEHETICNDMIDNDGDGFVDCHDEDCPCAMQCCNNGACLPTCI